MGVFRERKNWSAQLGSWRLISNFRHSFTFNLTNNRSKRVKKECGQTGSFSAKERREEKRSREKEREGKREWKRGKEWSDRSWRWNRRWMKINEEMKGKTKMRMSRIWREFMNDLLNGCLFQLLFPFRSSSFIFVVSLYFLKEVME